MFILSSNIDEHSKIPSIFPTKTLDHNDDDDKSFASSNSASTTSSESNYDDNDDDSTLFESVSSEHEDTARDHDDDDDDGNDVGFSEYERLRLKNIARNQKRLASLGLLRGTSHAKDENALGKTKMNASSAIAKKARKRKKDQEALPPLRRSRRCSKIFKRENATANSFTTTMDDESSVMPSPVPIVRTLRLQSHQHSPKEVHLKEYLRPRRIRRGRPRREEYEYKCEENCAHCGGMWMFDNSAERGIIGNVVIDGHATAEDDIDDAKNCDNTHRKFDAYDQHAESNEERTRLLRCKDCRGAFHIECMFIYGKENVKRGAQVFSRENSSDPKRCYRCEMKYQEDVKCKTTTCAEAVLEASIENRSVMVRVSIESLLEVNVDGQGMTRTVTLHGHISSMGKHVQSNAQKDRNNNNNNETITNHGSNQRNDDAPKIQQLIDMALSNITNTRLQARVCITLRKCINSKISMTAMKQMGGIRMLMNSLLTHLDRPNIPAEAMCTLGELYHTSPQLVDVADVNSRGGCLDLAMLAMERHPFHGKVQQMACRMFLALSYCTRCRSKLKTKKVVLAVVDSIRRNSKKQAVIMEGSMFLQIMMEFISSTTVNSMLKMKFRSNDGYPNLISTLLASIEMDMGDSHHVTVLLGLLSNLALTTQGGALLRVLNVEPLVINAIQEHVDAPHLHEVAYALLYNVLRVDESSCQTNTTQRSSELVNRALNSAMKYPRNKILQENVCRLLVVLASQFGKKVRRIVQGKRGKRILILAKENFPETCRKYVRILLQP